MSHCGIIYRIFSAIPNQERSFYMFCPKCGSEQEEGARFCTKCGTSIFGEPEKKVRKSGGGKAKKGLTVLGTFAALAVVVGITVNMTNSFLNDMNGEDTANVNTPSADSGAGSQSGQQSATNDDAYGRELAKLFAQTYSYEWKVKMFTEDGKTWKTYELGKKMAIAAFNFLNDQTITTGGYYLTNYSTEQRPRTSHTCPKCRAIDMFYRESVLSANWRCNYCGYVENQPTVTVIVETPEWVPRKTNEYHGKDIQYDCPTITITADSVDMRGLGGTVYSISEFRYEVSSDGNDRIVNDELKFALEYDGRYLNYKEPDEYGYYVGYYAYDTTDSLVNLTYVHDKAESRTY